jgi:hypothetical protein
MRIFLAKTRQRLRQWVWQPARALVELFHPLPPVAAIVIFFLLAFVGQIYEIYYSYIGDARYLPIILAAIVLTMLSVALHASHYWLSRVRETVIFKMYTRPSIGINYRRIRRVAGWMLAFSPWFGLAVGLALAGYNFNQHIVQLNEALRLVGGSISAPAQLTLVVGAAFVLTLLIGVLVVTLIHVLRRNTILLAIVTLIAAASIALVAVAPLFFANSVVIYRTLGPLATVLVAILFFYSLAAAFAFLSQKSNYPVLTLTFIAIVFGGIFKLSFAHVTFVLFLIFGVFALLAALARLWPTFYTAALMSVLTLVASQRDLTEAVVWNHDPNVAGQAASSAADLASARQDLTSVFDAWLKARKTGGKFPVFIVAVEGGGIYATAAAALFLAKLQDDAPGFAKHVFAISAVSGGAIGATLFDALAHAKNAPTSAQCAALEAPLGQLENQVCLIVQDDHLSPIVGAIIPDLLGETWGRAQELEASFLDSVSRVNADAATILKAPYVGHWSSSAGLTGPALVLNTTSAEAGYRVAFAPFTLNDSGDRTLFSLSDRLLTTEFPDPNETGESVPLMFAALASARFPVVLPPYAISVKQNGPASRHWWNLVSDILNWLEPGAADDPSNRWNLVDGGYADNSGAATALDLYTALADHIQGLKGGQDIDLKLIMLTSDDPAVPFSAMIGTPYGDTLAPIEAILNVRSGLARQAASRACDYIKEQAGAGQQQPCADETASVDPKAPWKIRVIKLQDEAYGLALGWEISEGSFDVVSRFVGHPDYCQKLPPDPIPNPKQDPKKTDEQRRVFSTAKEIANNSCAMRDIEAAVSAAP